MVLTVSQSQLSACNWSRQSRVFQQLMSHLFVCVWVSPELFKILTLKISGQCPWWGQTWKSQSGFNFLLTHMTFVPGQSATPLQGYSFFFNMWKSKVKAITQGHTVCPTSYWLTSLLFHFNQPSHSWDTAFSKFNLENPRSTSWMRSKSKVTKWVILLSYWFTSLSFHVNRPSSRNTAFSKSDFKIQSQGHSSRSHSGFNILSTHIFFVSC